MFYVMWQVHGASLGILLKTKVFDDEFFVEKSSPTDERDNCHYVIFTLNMKNSRFSAIDSIVLLIYII